MKILFGILLGTSVLFGIFSIAYGIEASEHSQMWMARLFRMSDREFRQFERERDFMHKVVRGVSIPFFLLCITTFSISIGMAKGRLVWRILAGVAIAVGVAMIVWSCILSGHVSFDEVFAAWIVVSVLFAGMSAVPLFWKKHRAVA